MRVVGCTRVKNGERYAKRWIEDMSRLCDFLCVLDDGSEDGTLAILDEQAKLRGNLFLRKQRGLPRDGGRDCNILYEMALSLKADWIFAPDIDEFVDREDFAEIRPLVECSREDVLGWTFPFFYFWDDERSYRADGDYANCHVIRLFRADPSLRPPKRISHSQLCPDELDRRRVRVAPARMVHYGYMDRADRVAKHGYYTRRDSDPMKAGAGVSNYDHILAEQGVLIKPYPSAAEWRGERLGWSIDRRLRRLAPGFPGGSPDEGGVIDEAILDGADLVGVDGIEALFAKMRPSGRVDISCMDFDKWVKDYAAAVDGADEKAKVELVGLMDGRRPIWEHRLDAVLRKAGFERIERLPVSGLHLIAFKPDEKKT